MAFSFLPNYHYKFYHDFNLANLEEKYFVGLNFTILMKKLFFKVIKVLETSTVYTGARVLNFH